MCKLRYDDIIFKMALGLLVSRLALFSLTGNEGERIMEAKKRLGYIDAIKGLAILVVVLHHLMPQLAASPVFEHLGGTFLLMFFCLAGYFYSPGKRTYAANLKSKLKSLMIPFFKYSFIFWLAGTVYHMIVNKLSLLESLCCLRNFYAGSIWNRVIQDAFGWDYHHLGKLYMFLADFWFLLALAFAYVLFLAIADWSLKSVKRSIFTMLSLIVVEAVLLRFNVTLPYNIQNTPYFAMLLLFGAFLRRTEFFSMFETRFSVTAEWVAGIILFIAGIIVSMYVEPAGNLFRGVFGQNQITAMLGITAASFLLLCGLGILMRRLELLGVRIKELCYLGENSLYIYIFHVFFAFFICNLTGIPLPSASSEEYPPTVKGFIVSGALVIVCTLLSLGVAYLENRRKSRPNSAP